MNPSQADPGQAEDAGLTVHCVDRIDAVTAEEWNRLAGTGHPFTRHEFLAALERNDCASARWGWRPQHLLVRDAGGGLLGALPLYLKDNSYGEFVFDWGWAEAYQRSGRPYYPKGVSAIPYTPASGPRLMLAGELDPGRAEAVRQHLYRGALSRARELGLSSLHWLFTTAADRDWLAAQGLALRQGCQFHWHNREVAPYQDFDDYLADFSAAKRKKLKRERRRVVESGIELRIVHGHEASARELDAAAGFYRSTFDRKHGYPTLNAGFFHEVAATMGRQLVLIFARHPQHHPEDDLACAICFRSRDILYGRHWGCDEDAAVDLHSLHFEACYYQGIEYCIGHGLRHFEPGAQGEHKVARGFRPTATWSAHWIADPGFAGAVADFVGRERRAIDDYMADLEAHLPFRQAGD